MARCVAAIDFDAAHDEHPVYWKPGGVVPSFYALDVVKNFEKRGKLIRVVAER